VIRAPLPHAVFVITDRNERRRLRSVWRHMKVRCNNQKHPSYPNYGGRGIKVCARWRDFEAFVSDVGAVPAGHSLDRVDNDHGYEPGNVRWATPTQQLRNTRRNVNLTAFGETKCAKDWSLDHRCSVHHSTILFRLRRGWTSENAIAAPPSMARPYRISAFGATKTISDWLADSRCRVHRKAIVERLASGWTAEDAIARPPVFGPKAKVRA
jgi:hypothetical protein